MRMFSIPRLLPQSLMTVFCLVGFTQCQEPITDVVLVRNHGPAQGSTYNISYVAPIGIDYRLQIDSILFAIDKSMSLWVKQSTISKLNMGDTVVLDDHFIEVLKTSNYISEETNGNFDISVAPLADYWGFGPNKRGEIDSNEVMVILPYVGFEKLKHLLKKQALPKGMKIDLNAIAQGYTVDVIADYLMSKNIVNFLVEVGGEVRTSGRTIDDRIWTIGVDKPSEELDSENRFQVIVALDSLGLATSGNYRKYWVDEKTGEKYVHTINPKTGFPIKSNLISTTIIAPTAMIADGWATACMVMGVDGSIDMLKNHPELEAYLVYTDKAGNWLLWQTEGFKKMSK